MAESRRKADARSKKHAEVDVEAEKARLARLDRLALALYLEGGVAIVVGMIVVAEFLSSGSVSRTVWIPAAVLGAILAVGIVFTVFARKRAAGEQA